MALKKYTFFGADNVGPNGWSNTLYRNEGDALNPDPTDAKALLNKWKAILGAEARWNYIRESRDDIFGDGKLTQLDDTFVGDSTRPIEQSGSCILATCRNDTRIRRKAIYLHGVWDIAITGGRYVRPNAAWGAAIDALVAELKNNGWGWKRVASYTHTAIATVAVVNTTQVQLTLADNVFVAPFDGRTKSVRLRGLSGVPKFKNPVIVTPTGPNVCIVRQPHTNVVNLPGRLSVPVFEFQQIQVCDEFRAVTHRCGRPFRPSAGGRRPRAA